jgi:hypothetical protein
MRYMCGAVVMAMDVLVPSLLPSFILVPSPPLLVHPHFYTNAVEKIVRSGIKPCHVVRDQTARGSSLNVRCSGSC